MKKLLFVLPFFFMGLFAETATPEQPKKESDWYFYINGLTHKTDNVINNLYPYYLGMGVRYLSGHHGFDFNIDAPAKIFKGDKYVTILSDLSYISRFDNDYYFISGLTNELGFVPEMNYYKLSPFIGFGKMMKLDACHVFVQAKINSLSYYPYADVKNKEIALDFKKDKYLMDASYNISVGVLF